MSAVLPPAQGGEVLDTVAVGQADLRSGGGFWNDVFRRLRRNPAAWIGAVIVLIFLLVAALAPLIAPYPETALPGTKYITPTSIPGIGEVDGFPLGLDRFGGDVLSKLIWGAQASLLVGVVSTALGLVGGMLLGLLAGTFGGWVDTLIMRIVDIILSVPNLLLAVSIAAILGQTPSAVMIAIGASQVPIFARLLRGSMLAQGQSDYVLAATALGLRRKRIVMSHVLPNSVGPTIVQATLNLATAIIEVAALSYLGLGEADPAVAEWGRMLVEAQDRFEADPRLALLPGGAIAITALGFTLFGEALREALDPRSRR